MDGEYWYFGASPLCEQSLYVSDPEISRQVFCFFFLSQVNISASLFLTLFSLVHGKYSSQVLQQEMKKMSQMRFTVS